MIEREAQARLRSAFVRFTNAPDELHALVARVDAEDAYAEYQAARPKPALLQFLRNACAALTQHRIH